MSVLLRDIDARPCDPSVEELAACLALRDPVEADELIDSLCGEAARGQRLQDALMWQRVKCHARLIRATHCAPPSIFSVPFERTAYA